MASKNDNRFFALTGGPGSGKTTLAEALNTRGYAITQEAGRGVIRQQMAIDGPALPWKDHALFAELMLTWEMRSYDEACTLGKSTTKPIFFDRGVPDVIGYLRLSNLPVPAHIVYSAEHVRYNRQVFMLPPWPEIFKQDTERRQDQQEAHRTYQAMINVYRALGYELIEVPKASVQDRVDFVLTRIAIFM